MNPILIGETLSESTQGYDRGEKFAHYRTIETFQEYVLIDQYQPHVEYYVKQATKQWLFTEYDSFIRRRLHWRLYRWRLLWQIYMRRLNLKTATVFN